MTAAEQALKIAPDNREANRVLGTVYAALSESSPETARGRGANRPRRREPREGDQHLETALDGAVGRGRSERARDAGAPVRPQQRLRQGDSAADRSRQPGAGLAGRPAAAGRGVRRRRPQRRRDRLARRAAADDPRLLPALADFYERERRWKDAAGAYARALQRAPRNIDLTTRYASALLNAGGRDESARRRATSLTRSDWPAARRTDARALYLLSQASGASAISTAAEAHGAPPHRAERRPARGATTRSPRRSKSAASIRRSSTSWRRSIAQIRGKTGDDAFDVSMLLPHLGFAYQELGSTTRRSRRSRRRASSSPDDPAIAGYLIEANIAAKKYGAAADAREGGAARSIPTICGLTRLEAQALRHSGKADRASRCSRTSVKKHADDPDRLHRARAGLLRRRARRAGGQGAAGRAAQVPARRRRSPSSSARCSTSRSSSPRPKRRSARCSRASRRTRGAQLSRLHARRARRAARRVGELPEAALKIEPENGVVSRQPRLGLLQGRQARSRRGQPAARRRSAEDQLGDPGSLRRRAVQARTLRRGDRRLDPRARRRRRLDRRGRHRQEDPGREAETPRRNEAPRGGCSSSRCVAHVRAARR